MTILGLPEEVWKQQRALALRGETDHLHYCYRCYDCGRLITKLDIMAARVARRVSLCTCASKKVRPGDAKVWEELLLPRCWKLILALYTGWVSPPPIPLSEEAQAVADRRGRELARAFDRQKTAVARRELGL